MTQQFSSFNGRNRLAITLVAMGMIGVGCTVDDADVPSDMTVNLEAQTGGGGDPGYPNHLEDYILMDHGVQYTVRNLGNARIADSSLRLPSMPYMPSPQATGDWANSRQDFLEVLISCALNDQQSVTDPGDFIGYAGFPPSAVYRRYYGRIGIAPAWTTRGLTTQEKRYLTGCVMGRVNRYGERVNILLEAIPGSYTPLEPTQAAMDMYPFPESRVWGNMFDSQVPLTLGVRIITRNPVLPFTGFVCNEFDSVFTGANGSLRQCDAIEACGFTYMGECDTVSHSTEFSYAVRARVQSGNIADICPSCTGL